MSSKELIERLTEDVRDVPRSVAVLETRQRSIREHLDRTQEFLATISEAVGFSTERADWVERKDRTLVRLTEGARAAVYHASGTMVLNTGLDPMAAPFRRA